MAEQRMNIISVFTGKRGTGKTTYTRALLKDKKRVLYLMTISHPAYDDLQTLDDTTIHALKSWTPDKPGIIRIVTTDPMAAMQLINKYVSNCTIVYEDAAKYIAYSLPDPVLIMVLDSKQRNNDIIMQFHCLMDVPPRLYKNADYLTIFKIRETPDQVAKAPKYIWPVVAEVNADPNPYANKTIQLE